LSQSSFCESSNTSNRSNLLNSGLAKATLTHSDCYMSKTGKFVIMNIFQ